MICWHLDLNGLLLCDDREQFSQPSAGQLPSEFGKFFGGIFLAIATDPVSDPLHGKNRLAAAHKINGADRQPMIKSRPEQ
jgi:hypothetical protein